MPGLGNILLALTGGAVQGYGQQVAQQRAQKTQFVLQSLMKYPEAAADPDFAKLAQSADIDKDALKVIGGVSQTRQALLNAQQQAQLKNMGDFIQRLNGEAPAQEGIPAGVLPPSPLAQMRSQASGAAAAPGAGMQAATVPTGPASAQTPGFAQAAQQQAPTGISGAIPPPPRPGYGFTGMTMGPKGPSYNIGRMTQTGEEQQQKSLQAITQYMQANPNVPPQEAVNMAVTAGWPVTPAMRQQVMESSGDAMFARLQQESNDNSADTMKRNARRVLSSGLGLSSNILQAAGMQTSGEKIAEAVGTEAGLQPYKKDMEDYRQQREQFYHSTAYTDPATGQKITISPDKEKLADGIIKRFQKNMTSVDDVKNDYNRIVGFLQDPRGLPQMDMVISYIRMAGGGRLNQAQIDKDLKSGTSAAGLLKKWTNIALKGDVIGPEQLDQIRNSSYYLYQQALAKEHQIRQGAEGELASRELPPGILPKGYRVIDPQRNVPIEWEGAKTFGSPQGAPAPVGQPAAAAPEDPWQAEARRRGLIK